MAKKHIQWEVTPLNFHYFGRIRYVENNELCEEKSELYSTEVEAADWVKERLGITKSETKKEDPAESPENEPVDPQGEETNENN